MEFVSQLGSSTLDALSYLGSLASLGARAAYYTLVAPFKGKPLRLQRAVSQAMDTGVRALPILSLITLFIGLILALQAAYELRRFGAINAVANSGRRHNVPRAWSLSHRHRRNRTFWFCFRCRNCHHESE